MTDTATTAALHWAADLIGKPYRAGCVGPHAFDCWGLVRHIFVVRHRVAMPVVALGGAAGGAENVAAIKRAAQASGWRLATAPAAEDDIVLMRGPAGRHVGVMMQGNGRLGLLHATSLDGVIFQPLEEAAADGYGEYEFWRRAA